MIKVSQVFPREQNARRKPACWDVEPEVFFGPADSPAGKPLYAWERRALAVCAGCPMETACLAEALAYSADEQYGVVGGMTAGQRQTMMHGSRRGHSRVYRSQHREVLVHCGDEAPSVRRGRPLAVAAERQQLTVRAAKAG
jgi:hypothetical protein